MSGFPVRRRRGRKLTASGVAIALLFAAAQLWSERHEPLPAPVLRAAQMDAPAKGEVVRGKVVKVSDGDTITILRNRTQLKVRMLGIDAPEKSQPFGNKCRENLAAMIAGKEVQVEAGKPDRYGRTIGRILIDGRDVNLAQVESGCAWHYKDYARNQTSADRERYSSAEARARAEKRGLWREPRAEAPWAYRKAEREERRPSASKSR